MNIRKKLLTAASAASLTFALVAGAAGAQGTGEHPFIPAGDRSCQGQGMAARMRAGEQIAPRTRYEIQLFLYPLVESIRWGTIMAA